MLKLPAYLTGFSSRSDGSASVRFSTQELSAEDFSTLKKYLNEFGYLLFKESVIHDNEIPNEEPVEDFAKTPSQRLYNVLFVYFLEIKNGDKADFPKFYAGQIEKYIEHIKSKLD